MVYLGISLLDLWIKFVQRIHPCTCIPLSNGHKSLKHLGRQCYTNMAGRVVLVHSHPRGLQNNHRCKTHSENLERKRTVKSKQSKSWANHTGTPPLPNSTWNTKLNKHPHFLICGIVCAHNCLTNLQFRLYTVFELFLNSLILTCVIQGYNPGIKYK